METLRLFIVVNANVKLKDLDSHLIEYPRIIHSNNDYVALQIKSDSLANIALYCADLKGNLEACFDTRKDARDAMLEIFRGDTSWKASKTYWENV